VHNRIQKFHKNKKRLFRADAKSVFLRVVYDFKAVVGFFTKWDKFGYLFSLSSSEKILFSKINYSLFYS
jgi:hypothetical protein